MNGETDKTRETETPPDTHKPAHNSNTVVEDVAEKFGWQPMKVMGLVCLIVSLTVLYAFSDGVYDVRAVQGMVFVTATGIGGPGYAEVEQRRSIQSAGKMLGGIGVLAGIALMVIGSKERTLV